MGTARGGEGRKAFSPFENEVFFQTMMRPFLKLKGEADADSEKR